MAGNIYVFQALSGSGEEIIGFQKGNDFSAEFEALVSEKLSKVLCLQFQGVPHIIPLSYEPTELDNLRRREFKPGNWLPIAAKIKEDAIVSFLIISQEDPTFSLVLSYKGCRIIDEIHGPISVNEMGEVLPLGLYLETLNIERKTPPTPPSKPVNLGSIPEIEEKDEVEEEPDEPIEVERPVFEPNAKHTFADTTPKKLKGDVFDEEEEPRIVDVSAFQSTFTGNSSKKPRVIKGDFKEPKKIPPSIPTPPQPKPSEPRKQTWEEDSVSPVDWKSFKTDFVPNRSNKPKKISDDVYYGSGKKPANLAQKKKKTYSKVIPVYSWNVPSLAYSFFSPLDDPERFETLSKTIVYHLNKINLVNRGNFFFVPEEPKNGSPYYRFARRFNMGEYEILGIVADSLGRIDSALLGFKEHRYSMVVLREVMTFPVLSAYIEREILLPSNRTDIGMIYRAMDNPGYFQKEKPVETAPVEESEEVAPEVQEEPVKEEPVVEEPAPEEPVKEDPVAEESIEEKSVPEANKEGPVEQEEPLLPLERVQQRRVFVSKRFTRVFKKFENKFHEQARRDIERLYETLTFTPKEELEKYLSLQDFKTISGNYCPIHKIRFGSSSEYDASRLFFIYGHEFEGRRINPSDILLLYLTENGEHDNQGDIAVEVECSIKDKDLLLDEILFPTSVESHEEVAYPSLRQFALLEEAKEKLPHLFLGSAGTGKTIVSFQNAFDGADPNERILYLTYQSELRDYSKKILSSKMGDNLDVFTFRDLCKALDLPHAKEMRDKGRFRRYLFEQRNKSRQLRKNLSLLGGEFEDQCLTCYSFYRGVAEGLASIPDGHKDILSQDEFLERTKKEQGFSAEQKRAIYWVCSFYQDHLRRVGGTTDNRLARDILLGGERYQIYDRIIVDEFQDLTEIQFKAICSLLKPVRPLRLYLYGDDNQAINPTIFDSQDAAAIVSSFFPRATLHVSRLSELYRSGNNLTHYINQVRAITTKSIGKRGGIMDVGEEENVRLDEDDVFVTLLTDPERFEDMVPQALRCGKEVKFLFPSATLAETYKERFQKEFGKELLQSSFLSVGKIKGQECDTAVLVNFFTSSREIFDAMLGEEKAGKKSTLHRMLFNRYYVALTRARNRVIVYEENASPTIMGRLLSGLAPLDDGLPLEDYFGGKVDPRQWMEEGKRRFNRRDYLGAMSAFSRARGVADFEDWFNKSSLLHSAKTREYSEEECIAIFARYDAYADLLAYYGEEQISGRYHLLSEILQGNTPFQSLITDALELLPKMGKEEAEVFFCLLSRLFVKEMEAKEKPLWKKNK